MFKQTKYLLFLFCILALQILKAQISNNSQGISALDSVYLFSIPEYSHSYKSNHFKNTELPYLIDNSQLPYFSPILEQIGWECHIANGIYYNLAYELNRLKNTAADIPENQLPSHFILNFLNGGNYDEDPSIIRGWELARKVGTPNVADYGGVYYGGTSRWMSGYEEYYHGMHNRVDHIYSIDVRDVEGVETLKHWLLNHFDEGEYGSLANCMVAGHTLDTLPQGTEEGGKLVVTEWGTWPGHSITIVGYNDSIRFDYNEDGLYTNDVDINGDGVINLKDFEIGAFKFANTYGTEWGDDGFAYMMCRLLGTYSNNGGIWDRRVFIIDAREQEPLLTMKINLKHDSRNKIKISAGVSSDTSSNVPEHILDFDVFNYQGGDRFMQGGGNEDDKYIEIGLDITPLLSFVESGHQSKYFLMIRERDPDGLASGEIVDFSVMDYTSGIEEILYPQQNIPLQDDDLTQINLNHTMIYDEVQLVSDNLDEAFIDESYAQQLSAEQGYPPYRWGIKYQYVQEQTTESFPLAADEKLSVNYGYASKELEFDFPFFDSTYHSLQFTIDGAILFDGKNPLDYGNIYDNIIYLRHLKTIMPFYTQSTTTGDDESGIWYEGDENSATFRWKTMVDDMDSSALNFAVSLFPSGNIEFYYGEMIFPDSVSWCSGFSNGEEYNVIESEVDNLEAFSNNLKILFEHQKFPMGMKINEDGLFSGVPIGDTGTYAVNFMVMDSREITKSKNLLFKVIGADRILEESILKLELSQNHPNPFSDFTFFDFTLKEDAMLELSIYNAEGKKLITLIDGLLTADHYCIKWDGTDQQNFNLPNGVYFYSLRSNNLLLTKKLIILK